MMGNIPDLNLDVSDSVIVLELSIVVFVPGDGIDVESIQMVASALAYGVIQLAQERGVLSVEAELE